MMLLHLLELLWCLPAEGSTWNGQQDMLCLLAGTQEPVQEEHGSENKLVAIITFENDSIAFAYSPCLARLSPSAKNIA